MTLSATALQEAQTTFLANLLGGTAANAAKQYYVDGKVDVGESIGKGVINAICQIPNNDKIFDKKSDGRYFSFDKIDDSIIAQGKLQIPYRPEYRISFDTLDIIDDISIPKGKWGTADYLEPITKDYRYFGPGGASQAVTYSRINSVKDIYKLR